MNEFLADNGASPIVPLAEADEMKGQENTHNKWMNSVVKVYMCVTIRILCLSRLNYNQSLDLIFQIEYGC